MKLKRNCRTILAASALCAVLLAAPAAADDSPTASARLGYDSYSVANLISTPNVLFSSEGEQFVDAAFAEMIAADPALQARLHAMRELLRAGNAPFDPADTGRAYLATLHDVAASLGQSAFSGYELGSFAATVAFDARVTREDATDASFRADIGSLAALDGSVPGLAAARAKLAADRGGAWATIAIDADAVATLATGRPAAPLRPAAADVWALLVRGRSIESDGPRKGTLHTSIEIVYGDGTHHTIGAYPDGRDDFTVTGGTLLCETDLEPQDRPSRAYPLVAPKSVTYEALARHFENACAAFDKRRPRFRYEPQDERGANDNVFVSGLLAAESLELPHGL